MSSFIGRVPATGLTAYRTDSAGAARGPGATGVRTLARSLILAAMLAGTAASGERPAERYDILLRGGRVIDGSGSPARRADVGISGDRIAAVGDLRRASASETIDASGQIVAPGFIDLHSHAFDLTGDGGTLGPHDDDPRCLAAPNLTSQGVTTVVINQDGRSPWPLSEQQARLQRVGIGLNVLPMIGHGTVRRLVMGADARRAARPDEIERMRSLVREGMRSGAWGLSAGLEYEPGRWSTTEEVVALVGEIVPYRGVYISHERSEGSDPMWFWPSRDAPGAPTLLDAVRETIEIGERTGAVVVASHLKAKGAHYWGSSQAAIELIERARARGVEVYADQYPYDTTGTDGVAVLLPPWVLRQDGGIVAETVSESSRSSFAELVEAALADPAQARGLRADIAHEIRRRGGAEHLVVLDHPDPVFVGRSLAELASRQGVDPVEMAILLQTRGWRDRVGGARLRAFSLSEIDIERIAARDWVATASDGGLAPSGGVECASFAHPRSYGTFPRKLRRYALERNIVSLEGAIRSATSLPARILGLTDRGTLRVGAMADIVIFDPRTIRDTATAADIHRYAEGVDWVLVNGRAVVRDGVRTLALPGRLLPGPGSRGTEPVPRTGR